MLDDVKLKDGISTTVVTTTLNEKGVAILFDIIDDEALTTEAAITDNYVEGNFAIQDHIAIKPKIYRLRGCVGEIVYRSESDLFNFLNKELANHSLLQKTLNATKAIAAVSGVVSNYTQAAMSIARQLESSYNRYKKMLDEWKDPSPIRGKRQQEVVSMLNFILQNRIPVTLHTLKYDYDSEGLGVNYENDYYLQSVSSHQGQNNFITDIEITIKEVRYATTKITTLDKSKFNFGEVPTSDIQKSAETNQGIANTKNIPQKTEKTIMNTLKETAKDAIKGSILEKPARAIYNNKWCQKVSNIVKNEIEIRKNITAEDYATGRARSIYKERGGIF